MPPVNCFARREKKNLIFCGCGCFGVFNTCVCLWNRNTVCLTVDAMRLHHYETNSSKCFDTKKRKQANQYWDTIQTHEHVHTRSLAHTPAHTFVASVNILPATISLALQLCARLNMNTNRFISYTYCGLCGWYCFHDTHQWRASSLQPSVWINSIFWLEAKALVALLVKMEIQHQQKMVKFIFLIFE